MSNWTIFFYLPFIILTLEHVAFSWTTEFPFFLATEYWAKSKALAMYLWYVIFCYNKYTAMGTGCKKTLGCVMALLTVKPYLHTIYPSPAIFIFYAKLNPRLLPLSVFFIQTFAGIIHFISIISMKKKKLLEDAKWFYVVRIWSWDFHDEMSQLCHDILTEKDVSKS